MSNPTKPQDHKPKKPKAPKSDQPATAEEAAEAVDREETVKKVTIGGVEYSVDLTALRNPRTADDLGVLQEVEAQGADIEPELAAEVTMRLPGLLRRLLGYAQSRRMHVELEREHGADYNFGHTTQFLVELIRGVRPNS